MALNHLVGRYFSIGDCVLYGGRLNVPCRYLEDLLGKKVFKPLINRSGLNCRVLLGGAIRPGDPIEPREPQALDPALRAANEAVPLAKTFFLPSGSERRAGMIPSPVAVPLSIAARIR